MKKLTFAILAAILAAILLLSACSTVEVHFVFDEPPTTQAPVTQPPTTEPPTTEPVSVPNVNTGN